MPKESKMSSVLFRIEVYEHSFGCPDYNLMGYDNLVDIYHDCKKHYEILEREANKK